MIFKFMIIYLWINPINSGLFCNETDELHYETWCYKLYDVNLLVNFESCLTNNLTQTKSCFINQLNKILDLYLLNSKLDTFYEFTVLKSPFKNLVSTKIYMQLIEKLFLTKSDSNMSFVNILFNVYSFQNHGYMKNHPFKIENPNLLKHPDADLNNSTEKCLFVHQTKNLNEKFSFKYGNCDKNFTFICIKNPNQVKNVWERCSSYIESSPGGKWIECDKLFKIIDQIPRLLISNSQKCCMYNFNWKVNFTTANKICSYFESEVFNFEDKGFTSMLNSYDSYLDLNDDFENNSQIINFWTSCKITNFPHSNEFSCEKDSNKIEKYYFETPLENGFLIYFLHYSFKNQKDFRIKKLNISQILRNFDQKVTSYLNEFVKDFTQNMFLLVRRKETHATNLTSTIAEGEILNCFDFNIQNETIFNLPILDKCLQFSTINDQKQLKNFSSLVLNRDLKFHDITDMICLIGKLSNRSANFLNMEKACLTSDDIREKKYLISNDLHSKKWNFSGNEMVLKNLSLIEKIIELNCYDTAEKIQHLIDDCIKFNHHSYCKFRCPKICDYDSDKYQVITWQVGNFKYDFLSSICKSAHHSNKTKGLIYFSKKENFEPTMNLVNNGIESFKSPIFSSKGKLNYFYFQNPVQIRVQKNSIKLINTLVLIKAVHFVRKDKINPVSFKIFSKQNIGFIKLKYLIPFFDDFHNVVFTQKTQFINNCYETKLSANLTYKKLININNYFEIYNYGVKFPINLINKDYNYFILRNYPVLRISFNQALKIKFHQIKNLSNINSLSCYWYLYNLNTFEPCSHELMFSQINATMGKNLIFFPRTQEMDLNFFKKFTRVIFIENNSKETCSNGGFFIENQCICYPGFGGYRCETICKRGNFGFDCEYKCPNKNCSGYLICTNDPIGCSCISGLNGFYCDEECPENRWGPSCLFDCQYCPYNKCNSFDGSCLCNNKSFGFYCEKCIDGFYGENCEYYCPKSCIKCRKENGQCLDTSFTTNMINTNMLNSSKFIHNQDNLCYQSILKCEFSFFNIYFKKQKNKTEKSLSCLVERETNFQYCNFIEKGFDHCIQIDSKIFESKSFCGNFQNLIKLESIQHRQIKFSLQNNSEFLLVKKIIFILLNASNNTDNVSRSNFFNEYKSLFIFCDFHNTIVLNFSIIFHDSCSDKRKISFNSIDEGFYELFTIIELMNSESSSSTTWIKLNKFLLYFSSQIVENCSENKNSKNCKLFMTQKTAEIKCNEIHVVLSLVILSEFVFFIIFSQLKNLKTSLLENADKKKLEAEFILTFDYNLKFVSTF